MPKSMTEREGRDPLAEHGRLVVSAEMALIARRSGPTGGMWAPPGQCREDIDCEKAGTHWRNVGASWSVPRGH